MLISTATADVIGAADADAICGATANDAMGAADAYAIGRFADSADALINVATPDVIGAAGADAIGGAEAEAVMQFNSQITESRAQPALLPLLCCGSSNSLRDTEGHSILSPVLNLTNHLFSPLAAKIVPSSCCLFCLLTWLPSGLQRDGKNGM